MAEDEEGQRKGKDLPNVVSARAMIGPFNYLNVLFLEREGGVYERLDISYGPPISVTSKQFPDNQSFEEDVERERVKVEDYRRRENFFDKIFVKVK